MLNTTRAHPEFRLLDILLLQSRLDSQPTSTRITLYFSSIIISLVDLVSRGVSSVLCSKSTLYPCATVGNFENCAHVKSCDWICVTGLVRQAWATLHAYHMAQTPIRHTYRFFQVASKPRHESARNGRHLNNSRAMQRKHTQRY